MAILPRHCWKTKTHVYSFRELYEFSRDQATGEVLYRVAHKLCSIQAEAKFTQACAAILDLPAQIHELASLATTICSPGTLLLN